MVKPRIEPREPLMKIEDDPDVSLGDAYRAINDVKKERRKMKRGSADQLLSAAGLKFEWKNLGAHLIVHAPDGRIIDFWPGTSLWIVRGDSVRHRGGPRDIIATCKGHLPLPDPEESPAPDHGGLL